MNDNTGHANRRGHKQRGSGLAPRGQTLPHRREIRIGGVRNDGCRPGNLRGFSSPGSTLSQARFGEIMGAVAGELKANMARDLLFTPSR
jgi:hypothetical protein